MLRGSSKANIPSSILGVRHFRGMDERQEVIPMIVIFFEYGYSIVFDYQES